MVIDPGFKKILELINSAGIDSMSVEDLRKAMSENPLARDTEDIKSFKDLTIEHHGVTTLCRLYEPEDTTGGLIVYLHGGGFVFGDVAMFDGVCRKAANRSKCKVLSVQYRLAPESKFPAAVEDAYESYVWAREKHSELGIDPDRIAIAGDSAGGNLSAVVCLKSKDNNFPLPRLQVLFYPALGPDLYSESMREYSTGYFLSAKAMRMFSRMYLNSTEDSLNPYFSPIYFPDLSGLPEAIIITGEHDPLRDQAESFLVRLYESGVQATGIRAKGMMHGFLNFSGIVPAANSIASMVWSEVGRKLGGMS